MNLRSQNTRSAMPFRNRAKITFGGRDCEDSEGEARPPHIKASTTVSVRDQRIKPAKMKTMSWCPISRMNDN